MSKTNSCWKGKTTAAKSLQLEKKYSFDKNHHYKLMNSQWVCSLEGA